MASQTAVTSVVVVADLDSAEVEEDTLEQRHDLERTGEGTLRSLLAALWRLGLETHHVNGPGELARCAVEHPDAVVLTLYGGERSRSRMALVPAVCESLGLRFIGPDAYGRICAQDKEVSKRLAADCGLLTPEWRVIRDPYDLHSLREFGTPVVVKPLLEGTSIGIGKGSLQHDWQGVEAQAARLLETHEQPVMIEKFVPGREVSYNAIQTPNGAATSFCEIAIDGDPAYFQTHLLDLQEKFFRKAQRHTVNIDGELSGEDEFRIRRLLSVFGRYGYCRVDGRLHEGRFHFIELTPDAWIDPSGQFAAGYTSKGWTYDQVIAAVVASVGPFPPPP